MIFLTPHIWVALIQARWTHSTHLPSGQGRDPSHTFNPTSDRREHDTEHSTAAGCLRGWSWLICFRSELTMPQGSTAIFIRCRCALREPGIVVAMRSSVQPAERAWACQCHGSIAMSTKWHHWYNFCVPISKILNVLITHPWSLKKTQKTV